MHMAAEFGRLSVVKWYFDNVEGDKNPPMKTNGKTVMHIATEFGKLSVVKWYLDNLEGDKNPSMKTNSDVSNGRTPLHSAAQEGHLDIVKAISKVLVDKNPGDGHNTT